MRHLNVVYCKIITQMGREEWNPDEIKINYNTLKEDDIPKLLFIL